MSSPGFALQKGLFSALTGSAALVALLGGARVYDDAPQPVTFPFITIDPAQERDWSTGTEPGLEHLVTIHVWSRYAGRRQIYDVADAIRDALDGASLTLEAHRLINLRHQYSDLRREEDGETYHAALRFRAVTEPI
ncbi:MAG: DUF3168 domain-containing protein [Hyphomicrobiales bacterium]|nr:DUF3168 domain-containing protein [Hyphomicrobiales bacterium]